MLVRLPTSPAGSGPDGNEQAAALTRVASSIGHGPVAGRRLGHRPALDGLRGAAVIVILVFHTGARWLPGGYLAVSAFFTLSGFLITRALIEERERTGTVRSGAFYGRRIRRLLPACSVVLLAVVVLAYAGVFEDVADLRRELVGASLQLANWVHLSSGSEYRDLFQAGASPVEHFWSLAVEEQFYVLWPLVFVIVSSTSMTRVRNVVIGLLVLAVVAAPAVARIWGPEAGYLATPARFGEILSGAVLAMVFDWHRPPPWLKHAALVAGMTMLVLMVVTPFDHGWAYQGGLPLFSVLSCLVVAGALVDGPMRTALSWRGLVVLGTLSYVVYLVHWPVYVIADTHWRGLGSPGLVGAKVVVTFAVAIAIFALVERPLRRAPLRRSTVVALVAALASVGLLAAAVIPDAKAVFRPLTPEVIAAVDLEPVTRVPPVAVGGFQQRPVRILIVGDSTGTILGNSLVTWAFGRQREVRVRNASVLGCGLLLGGRTDNLADFGRADCDRAVGTDIPEAMAALHPDVVLVSISAGDAFPRAWDDGPLRSITDPEFVRHIAQDYGSFFAAATAAGVPHLLWLRPPVYGDPPDPSFADGGQRRIEEVVQDQAERFPGVVSILDFRAWFESEGLDERPVRPDAIHLYPAVADAIVSDYLGPALVDAALGR